MGDRGEFENGWFAGTELGRLAAEMERVDRLDFAPDEVSNFPERLRTKKGFYAFLNYRYGNAGEAETDEKTGIENCILSYFFEDFSGLMQKSWFNR